MTNAKVKRLFSNLTYAFLSQCISLLLSLLMSFVVPKFLSVKEFGYWQLFLFYTSYVGFTHFGLDDGIYLREGGKRYKDLDFSLIGSQFWLLMFTQAIFAGVISAFSFFFEKDPNKLFVILLTGLYMIIFNVFYFLGFIFQATNHTKKYSISIIIYKLLFIVCIFFLFISRDIYYRGYVVLYTLTLLISLLYCMAVGRRIVFAPLMKLSTVLLEAGRNIVVGINLLIANMAGLLIIGSGRLVVEQRWGIESFGKFSFSISICNFFLMFVGQTSMVLFPALRQTNFDNIKKVYVTLHELLDIVLSGMLLFYFPISYILGFWLPQYKESLKYMSILLPLCTFDGKMQMLCNTYLQVLRKERWLLFINVASFLISLLLALLGAYILCSIQAVVVFMVVAVAFRSIVSELYTAKLMESEIKKEIAWECFFAISFIVLSLLVPTVASFLIYLTFYIAYLVLHRNKVGNIVGMFKRHVLSKG